MTSYEILHDIAKLQADMTTGLTNFLGQPLPTASEITELATALRRLSIDGSEHEAMEALEKVVKSHLLAEWVGLEVIEPT